MGKKIAKKEENTDKNSGHYVIASSRPPERRPLERRRLVTKFVFKLNKIRINELWLSCTKINSAQHKLGTY